MRSANVLAALSVLAACAPVAAADDPRVLRVIDAWKKRQTAVKVVRYEVEGTTHTTEAGVRTFMEGTAPPTGGRTHLHKWNWLIDFPNNRYRFELMTSAPERQTGRPLVTEAKTTYYDGSVKMLLWGAFGTPLPQSARPSFPWSDYTLIEGDLRQDYYSFVGTYTPPFIAHGSPTTSRTPFLRPGRMTCAIEPQELRVQGEGVIDGAKCLVLRTQDPDGPNRGTKDFWVDLARDAAVVRENCYPGYTNKPPSEWNQQTNYRYQRVAGRWLSAGWTTTLYWSPGQVGQVEEMQIKRIECEPAVSDADFRLHPEPGQLVAKYYAAPGEWERARVYDESRVEKTPYYRISSAGSWVRVWFVNGVEVSGRLLWGTPAALVALVVAVWFLRYRRSVRRPAEVRSGG